MAGALDLESAFSSVKRTTKKCRCLCKNGVASLDLVRIIMWPCLLFLLLSLQCRISEGFNLDLNSTIQLAPSSDGRQSYFGFSVLLHENRAGKW